MAARGRPHVVDDEGDEIYCEVDLVADTPIVLLWCGDDPHGLAPAEARALAGLLAEAADRVDQCRDRDPR